MNHSKRVKNLFTVVNDAAERTVKLYSDYAAILTENKEQRASLLQVVEKHRKQVGDFKKLTLDRNNSQLQYLEKFPIFTSKIRLF